MLLCLALALPALLIALPEPDAVDPAEARSLATSMQSWRHQLALTDPGIPQIERWVPQLNDEPQLRQPPGITWSHVTAFALTAQSSTHTKSLIFRARLMSVLTAVLTVIAVYWGWDVDFRRGHWFVRSPDMCHESCVSLSGKIR